MSDPKDDRALYDDLTCKLPLCGAGFGERGAWLSQGATVVRTKAIPDGKTVECLSPFHTRVVNLPVPRSDTIIFAFCFHWFSLI